MSDVNEVADALGLRVVVPTRHGESVSTFEVLTADGTDALLKIGTDAFGEAPLVAALRARGYPIPAVLRSGSAAGVNYELSERVDGAPMDQPTLAQLPAVRRVIALQRAVGLGSGEWVEHVVASITDGCVGYCEHAAMQAHSEQTCALLDRLRRVADARRDIEVPTGDAVHYDFSPYNILADGDRITGVVDWGDVTAGDASFDLVTLAFYTYDFAVRDALLAAAYESTCPEAVELYVAHMVLRQVDWSLRHHGPAEVEWFMGIGEALLDRVSS